VSIGWGSARVSMSIRPGKPASRLHCSEQGDRDRVRVCLGAAGDRALRPGARDGGGCGCCFAAYQAPADGKDVKADQRIVIKASIKEKQ